MKEHRFSLPFPSFGCRGSQFSVKHLARSNIAHVEVRMNSKTLRSAETWTEIARLFARLALGASFLSAVSDRFGLWGPYGAKNVSWGNFAHFVEYTGAVTSLFPSSSTVSFAWAATVAETLFGILLIAGFKIRMASVHLRSSPFVICYRHGHRSWHQDAIRLFGLLGSRCSILTAVLGA